MTNQANAAAGWAVLHAGQIDVRTVGPTRHSALVNWLIVERRYVITNAAREEEIEAIWESERKRSGASVIPVTVQQSRGN